MGESKFSHESIAECIAAVESRANLCGSLHRPKYDRLARSMRAAARRHQDHVFVYYTFPSHRLREEFQGYTVGG
jgi:hypothetical protein